MALVTSTLFPPAVNAIGDDVSATVMMGKVIRPLRSVDPSQTDYQGLIEVTEEGWCCCGVQPVLCHFLRTRIPPTCYVFMPPECRSSSLRGLIDRTL